MKANIAKISLFASFSCAITAGALLVWWTSWPNLDRFSIPPAWLLIPMIGLMIAAVSIAIGALATANNQYLTEESDLSE